MKRNDMQYHSEVVERDGYRFRITKEYDQDADMPWENDCGTGIVSEWTTRDKRPGEIVLCEDQRSKRFYDFAGTMRKARDERWGLDEGAKAALEYHLGRRPTYGEICEAAVKRDFQRLRGFVRQDWWYCGVIVTLLAEDDEESRSEPDYAHAVWRVEDGYADYGNYWRDDVAEGLIEEYLYQLKKEAAERQHWAERDVVTT